MFCGEEEGNCESLSVGFSVCLCESVRVNLGERPREGVPFPTELVLSAPPVSSSLGKGVPGDQRQLVLQR